MIIATDQKEANSFLPLPLPQVTSLSTTHTLSLSAAASNIAEEALAAIATVKAFCAESEEVQRSDILSAWHYHDIIVMSCCPGIPLLCAR